MKKLLYTIILFVFFSTVSCEREPDLHLYEGGEMSLDFPFVELDLETYWNYEMIFGIEYDWRAEWYYGWDDIDYEIFGNQGYTEPSVFNLRRYYTGRTAYLPHTSVISDQITTTYFHGRYNWGFWDVLVWNDITTIDGVQSLIFDEKTTLDSVFASTNQSMRSTRYEAPKYTRAFYAPEELFSTYARGIEINENLDGFEYDASRNVWVKKLDMILVPVTYIYLTQVILHNNRGRVTGVDGTANLSGMARTMNINTGQGGSDAITVGYSSRFKTNRYMNGEIVDIAGGRVVTFGIPNLAANKVLSSSDIKDKYPHYMDVNLRFSNGMDSTLVFNVTNQVRKRFKGGVLTIELDMDTVPIPRRKGGSGFNAVVEEYKEEQYEFDM